jgi:hypothetical protein
MTDDGETEAPRGPLFVALDLYERIPRIRTACAALGVPLASVDLKDGPRAEIGFGTTAGKHGESDHRGFASIEVVAGYEVRLSIEATHRLDRPAPLGSVIAQLRASVAALDILLEPPGEVVDAEFIEVQDEADRAFILAGNVSLYLRALDAGTDQKTLEAMLRDIGELAGEAGLVEQLRGLGDRIAGPFWRDREKTLEMMHKAAEAEVDKLRAEVESLQRSHAAGMDMVWKARRALGIPDDRTVNDLTPEIDQLQAALQGAREGRAAAWAALADLAKRADVVLVGDESAAEIADVVFAASARGKEQREIDALLERLAEVRKAVGLDEDCYHGAVMERLGLLKSLADAVMAELEVVDLDGVERMAVECLRGGRDNRRQYLELAAAIGCGTSTAHDTAIRKAEQLQRDATAAGAEFTVLQKLRARLGIPSTETPDAVAKLAVEILDARAMKLADIASALWPDRTIYVDNVPAEEFCDAIKHLREQATAHEKAGLERREAAAFSALQRLRMALFMSTTPAVTPAEIVEAALARIEASGAATRKAEALLADLSKMKARLSAAVSSFEEVGRQLLSLDAPAATGDVDALALAEQQAREAKADIVVEIKGERFTGHPRCYKVPPGEQIKLSTRDNTGVRPNGWRWRLVMQPSSSLATLGERCTSHSCWFAPTVPGEYVVEIEVNGGRYPGQRDRVALIVEA